MSRTLESLRRDWILCTDGAHHFQELQHGHPSAHSQKSSFFFSILFLKNKLLYLYFWKCCSSCSLKIKNLCSALRGQNISTRRTTRAVKVFTNWLIDFYKWSLCHYCACALTSRHQINRHNATWSNQGRKLKKSAAHWISATQVMFRPFFLPISLILELLSGCLLSNKCAQQPSGYKEGARPAVQDSFCLFVGCRSKDLGSALFHIFDLHSSGGSISLCTVASFSLSAVELVLLR